MVKKITKYQIISVYLNDFNRKYYLREIASLLKKPHQTIKPYLEELVVEKILERVKKKNIIEFGLNLKDNRVYDYIVVSEKEKLLERLKQDILVKILFEKLSNFFQKYTFIIFGSSVDKLKENSDIDLLVIGKGNVEIKEFEDTYNKKIHKIQVNKIKDITNTLLEEIYKKHLILNNTEQIVRYFGEKYG